METEQQEKEREEKAKKKKKKKKKLPYWMKYFAWTLQILTSFTAAFFVVLYGFQFGKEKSAQWISALMISFFQDVCVSQPIKILGLGLFIALIIKKPAEDEDELDKEKINSDSLPRGKDNSCKIYENTVKESLKTDIPYGGKLSKTDFFFCLC